MEKEIEKAIRETLVISNPQSIHIAVKKILLLFSVSGRNEQFNCGKERVFGEKKCDKQCDDCLKDYGSN